MGRPPAVIIVARHGARLDAADTQWHLTSPTPYDPPLTYGGWKQSQALGARIANIIHLRESAAGSQTSPGLETGSEADGDSEGEEGRNLHHLYRGQRRKHKVVIHTSPFLRCVQTSVAISAGIVQNQEPTEPHSHSPVPKHSLHSGSSHVQTVEKGKSTHLSAIPEPEPTGILGQNSKRVKKTHRTRTLLRVDAFLGEWLSPDYFDQITPPPESKLMVASAKAELLREGDPIETVHASTRVALSQGNFPGGWGSPVSARSKVQATAEDVPLADLSSLSQALPRLGRANSHTIGIPMKRSNLLVGSRVKRSPSQEGVGYVLPVPPYAISPSQPIPQGYVAHARDACVTVDYQWDSLRPPLQWGDGGGYGEEWSSMHKRFRRGLHEMISWYRSHDPNALTRTLSEGLPKDQAPEEQEDDETDTVLVLVTHGAGCNALIGALTNQPVLMDVGMASLTMATQKIVGHKRVASPFAPRHQTSPSRRRNSSFDVGISDDYDVKIIASTDHLKAGSRFLPQSQLQRTSILPVREKSPYRYERNSFANSHHKKNLSIDEDDEFRSESDSATSTEKAINGGPNKIVTAVAPSMGGGGLWSKPVAPKFPDVAAKDNKQSMRLCVPQSNGIVNTSLGTSNVRTNGSPTNGILPGEFVNSAVETNGQGHSIAPSGLWGAPPQALATERDSRFKRRWTLSLAS